MVDFLASLEPSFYRELKYRQLADGSIENYRRVLKVYRNWLIVQGHEVDETCLQVDAYLKWSEWVEANRAGCTANLYFRLMTSFSRWAVGKGELSAVLPAVKADPGPRRRQVIEDDTPAKLVKASKQHDKHYALRAELIVRLLLDTGIRRSELVGIKLSDIDFDDLSIEVTGKGNKTRHVYFGNNTGRALDRWLRTRHRFPMHKTCMRLGTP